MLVGELRNKADKLWEEFWTGGVANPITVIEQITYLLFFRSLDQAQTKREEEAMLLGTKVKNIFAAHQQNYRWQTFKQLGKPEAQFQLMQQEIFPFLQNLFSNTKEEAESVFSKYMKGATFMIPNARLLTSIIGLSLKPKKRVFTSTLADGKQKPTPMRSKDATNSVQSFFTPMVLS